MRARDSFLQPTARHSRRAVDPQRRARGRVPHAAGRPGRSAGALDVPDVSISPLRAMQQACTRRASCRAPAGGGRRRGYRRCRSGALRLRGVTCCSADRSGWCWSSSCSRRSEAFRARASTSLAARDSTCCGRSTCHRSSPTPTRRHRSSASCSCRAGWRPTVVTLAIIAAALSAARLWRASRDTDVSFDTEIPDETFAGFNLSEGLAAQAVARHGESPCPGR